MGFSIGSGISAAAVFVQGLLSFFSPCVLPLLPVYIGYLSGGTAARGDDGRMRYDRKKVAVNTFFFVLGIGAAFLLLGIGMTAAGRFFGSYRRLFTVAGGVVVILFGLYRLGIFGEVELLDRERRLPFYTNKMAMSPLAALIMGFLFSFAWTPCVGPTLSSVLIMAASSEKATGMFLIFVYTLGFTVPFLAVGLFTTTLLDLFRKHGGIVRYTAKIGGALLVVIGILMITGYIGDISGYFSRISGDAGQQEASDADESVGEQENDGGNDRMHAVDFELTDQYGTVHRLSDYTGRTVFLNFWATWCGPCRSEMPDIQSIYEKYAAQDDPDVIILGVAFPGIGGETDEAGIAAFLEENGYTYPVLMDAQGVTMGPYNISAYPTTYMIDKNGDVYGGVIGAMEADDMQSIIDQTVADTD